MKKVLLFILLFPYLLYAQCFYELDVNFDFKNKLIKANAKIYDTQKSILLDTQGFEFKNPHELQKALNNGANRLTFSFEKKIKKLNEQYIYLLNDWYPKTNDACVYTLKTSLDKSYTTIYEQTQKKVQQLSLIASKDFIQTTKTYNGITLNTYFLREDKQLSNAYLDKTIEYIQLFEKRIAPFPFKTFNIIENIYQTGYSMPTFTLIGSRLLNKPYVLKQSLAHEIAHQYFGNAVFNDFSQGNWIEGMTTFIADDYLKALNKTDITHRKSVITEYTHFVNSAKEFPISEFVSRFDKASMLIGYSKLSFVFHMLQKKIGEKKFNELIQKLYLEYAFKELNLNELIVFFNTHTKTDLKPFFKQWLYKKGLIDFKIENITTNYSKDGFALEFDVIQDEKNFYTFDLPLQIQTYDKTFTRTVSITEPSQSFSIATKSEILKVSFDKNIDLFRTLSQKEKIFSIASILNEKELLAVVNVADYEQYQWIKKLFPNIHLVNSEIVTFQDLKKSSVIFLGHENSVLKYIYPQTESKKNNSYMQVLPHAYNENKTMMVLHDALNKSRYFLMMKHYSKYKEVLFTQDSNTKQFDKSHNGIIFELNTVPIIKKISKPKTLQTIIPLLEDKKIVYISESHNNFSHHLNQLRIIKALHKNKQNIVIGMEMFQKTFQPVLDEYIQTDMSLNEFLKKSEYFKRWKFDYNLYRPIIDYAKANKIPIIALNIDRDITKSVGKRGLLSLSKKQKEQLPLSIDQSNVEYKKSLEEIFKQHPGAKQSYHAKTKPNLDYFYQSQLIWDEIMAQNIVNYRQKHPQKTMVVLAGSGHIENHFGIPSRVYKKLQEPYQVILNDRDSIVVGDIVITNQLESELPTPHKLGVYLESSEEMIVQGTVENSFAQKVALKKDDKIIRINDEDVENIYDIKRILYFVDDMNSMVIQIHRDNKTVELKIKE